MLSFEILDQNQRSGIPSRTEAPLAVRSLHKILFSYIIAPEMASKVLQRPETTYHRHEHQPLGPETLG